MGYRDEPSFKGGAQNKCFSLAEAFLVHLHIREAQNGYTLIASRLPTANRMENRNLVVVFYFPYLRTCIIDLMVNLVSVLDPKPTPLKAIRAGVGFGSGTETR